MLPTNPLLQLTPLRTQRGVARLAELIWHDPRPLRVEATAARPEHLGLAAATRLPRKPVRDGESWGRLYDQRWCRVTIPAGAGRWLRWDEQGEATLFLNGTPFYGFDVAHRTCELPAGVREAWVESLCVQSAIWHPDAKGLGADGNVFRGAQLLRRDNEAWAAYHDLNCLYEWMLDLRAREFPGVPRELFSQTQQPALTDVSPLYRRLLRGLDTALDAFDTAGIAALRRELTKLYRELRDPRPLSRAALTGHSHLDLVWLWTEQVGEGSRGLAGIGSTGRTSLAGKRHSQQMDFGNRPSGGKDGRQHHQSRPRAHAGDWSQGWRWQKGIPPQQRAGCRAIKGLCP